MQSTMPCSPSRRASKVLDLIDLGTMDEHQIEVGVIRNDKVFTVLTPSQVREYLDELQ